MDNKLRIGIIGAGRIGKLHANNLVNRVPGAEVAAISDVVIEAAQALAEQLGVAKYTADYKEIINDPSIDAVFICSSTNTHSPISVEAAQAGKHIFCEKPIDHDLDKIRVVLEEVKKAGVKYQVGFNRRFDRNFKHVQEVVKAGGIGDVHMVKITSRDPSAPPLSYVRVSGGIFVDMTIHDFDMARYLSGSEVVEVSAFGACLVNPDIAKEKPLYFFLERYNDAFIQESNDFVNACLNGAETPVGAFDGLQPVLIAIAAKESCEKGGIPVKVGI